MNKNKINEFCQKSPDLYHKAELIRERTKELGNWSKPRLPNGKFHQELFYEKEYGCIHCKITKVVLFDDNEKPCEKEDMKNMAYFFARDFIQPSHPHFELLNGNGAGDEIRKVHRKTHEANLKTTEFKEWNQDFKVHYAKKRNWY